MSPPPPWQPQHLVFEAEREHYAATRDCQERGVINVVRGSGGLRTRPRVVAVLLKKGSRERESYAGVATFSTRTASISAFVPIERSPSLMLSGGMKRTA